MRHSVSRIGRSRPGPALREPARREHGRLPGGIADRGRASDACGRSACVLRRFDWKAVP